MQILREISFGECKSSKTAVLTIFGGLKFVHLVNFKLLKVGKFLKNQNTASRTPKIDFTQNLSVRIL